MRVLRSRSALVLGLLAAGCLLFVCLLASVRFGAARIGTWDVILGLDFADNAKALDDFERSELFGRLGGVEAGRYFRLTPDESLAMYFASVLTVPVVLRVIEEKLGTLNP